MADSSQLDCFVQMSGVINVCYSIVLQRSGKIEEGLKKRLEERLEMGGNT